MSPFSYLLWFRILYYFCVNNNRDKQAAHDFGGFANLGSLERAVVTGVTHNAQMVVHVAR
jgi:hypothetical protein